MIGAATGNSFGFQPEPYDHNSIFGIGRRSLGTVTYGYTSRSLTVPPDVAQPEPVLGSGATKGIVDSTRERIQKVKAQATASSKAGAPLQTVVDQFEEMTMGQPEISGGCAGDGSAGGSSSDYLDSIFSGCGYSTKKKGRGLPLEIGAGRKGRGLPLSIGAGGR